MLKYFPDVFKPKNKSELVLDHSITILCGINL